MPIKIVTNIVLRKKERVEMLEGISQIKDKVHSSKYVANDYSGFDVEAVVANLRKDPKFKKFSDSELYEYAYGLNEVHNMHVLKGNLDRLGYDTGKPKDPFWSQFTYEEILNMANDGVMVPQEFVDWANTMQDSDTVSYQIESASDDENTYDNLAADTGNIDKSDIQKRAQAFASKAEAQEELIQNKCEDAKPQVAKVQSEKNELEQNQRMSLKKVETMTTEWQALDNKFKNGEELTDSEQKRYKELGLLLNDSNNNLMLQAQKVGADIEDLMNQIENIDMLLSINERINAEIEDVGTRMASFEGSKKHIILPSSSGNQVTGITAAFYAGAMGNNLAYDTGLTGVNLFFNNLEVEQEVGNNINLVNKTEEKVNIAYQAAEHKDENTKTTTNNQAENQGDDKKTDDNRLGAPDYKTENNDETDNSIKPSQPVLPQDEAQSPDNATYKENQVDSETGNVTGFADIVNESVKTEIKANTGLQSKTSENVSAGTPVSASGIPANATATTSAQTSETNETSEATEASSDTAVTETTENTETSVETEDPLEAATSQYVSECQNRNNSMQMAEQQIQPKIEQIKNVKSRQKQEDARAKAELDKSISEYEKLANKAKNGDDLSDNEQKRIKTLEKSLDSKNGTIIAAMRGKVNALTGFATELENDIQSTVDNQAYGEETIAKGKEYAQSVLGDRSYLKNMWWFNGMDKEKQYDLLYGKAGESIGRDAIDNGELLVSNAAASNARLSKSLPLAGFAQNYAEQLTQRIAETNQRVNSVKQSLKQSADEKAAEANEGSSKNNDGSSSESSSSKKKEQVTEADGKKVEQQGKEVKKEGQEAKKDGQDAKKDKQATDKQIKSETAALKSDEKRIKNYTKDSQEINKQFEEMATEVETIVQAQEQSGGEYSAQEGPMAGPQSMALNSNAQASNGVSLNSNAGSSNNSDNTAKLQAMAASVPNLDKRLKSNDKTIKTLSKSAQTKTKKLNKLYNIKYKKSQADIKAKEDKVKKNEKLQGTITKTGYVFTGTKLSGLALMSFPWSAAVGAYMYGIGKYGEITCYVTNAAIDVANGNFLGALVNVGAAALSYFTGPTKIGPATNAVTEAAAEGAKEAGKEVGKETLKEAGTQVTTEVAKDAGTELVGTSLKDMANASFQNMLESAGKDMAKTAADNIAKESAKHMLKETVKEVAMNAATAAMPTLIAMTHKEETAEPQKRNRRLVSYQEKRSREAKMDKIDHTKKVLMQRGKKR